MKVLFLSTAKLDSLAPNMVSDYQADMLFHGLRSILGNNCIDIKRMWWMYEKDKQESPDKFSKIWGKGFTVYGNLPSDDDIDRSNVYDLNPDIVCLYIHWSSTGYYNQVEVIADACRKQWPNSKLAVVDGWDQPFVPEWAKNYIYFKRELYPEYEHLARPISFAIPKEKIWDGKSAETNKYGIAPLIPVNQSIDPSYMSTYIYDNEEDYYKMYQQSRVALTSKKGGWDTLRHYEILANRCIPLFVDIDKCPPKTLHNFPKDLCKKVLCSSEISLNLRNGEKWVPCQSLPHCGIVEKDNPGEVRYGKHLMYLQHKLTNYLQNNLTTEHLAKYFLEAVNA